MKARRTITSVLAGLLAASETGSGVVLGPGIGRDVAVVDAGGEKLAVTPTCAGNRLGLVPEGDCARGEADAITRGFDALAAALHANDGGAVAEAVLARAAPARGFQIMSNQNQSRSGGGSVNKMLIDATHPEETRVVVLRQGRVVVPGHDVERRGRGAGGNNGGIARGPPPGCLHLSQPSVLGRPEPGRSRPAVRFPARDHRGRPRRLGRRARALFRGVQAAGHRLV